MGGWLRLVLAVAAAAIGATLYAVSQPSSGGRVFDGSVSVLPDQPGVDATVTVRYLPSRATEPVPGDKGQIEIDLVNNQAQGDAKTQWSLLLADDAILDHVRLLQPEPSHASEPLNGFEFSPPWPKSSGSAEEYEELDFSGPNRIRIIGVPRRSPVTGDRTTPTLTMPRVLTSIPTSGWPSGPNVVQLDVPNLVVLQDIRRRYLPPAAQAQPWGHPIRATLYESGGYSLSSQLLVDQAFPELKPDTWGSWLAWSSDRPFGASALLSTRRPRRPQQISSGGVTWHLAWRCRSWSSASCERGPGSLSDRRVSCLMRRRARRLAPRPTGLPRAGRRLRSGFRRNGAAEDRGAASSRVAGTLLLSVCWRAATSL